MDIVPDGYIDVTDYIFESAASITGKSFCLDPTLQLSEALRVPEYGNPLLDAIACLSIHNSDPRLSLSEILDTVVPEHAIFGILADFFCLTESMSPVCITYHGIVAGAIQLVRTYMANCKDGEQGFTQDFLSYVCKTLGNPLSDKLYMLFSVYAILMALILLGLLHRNAFITANCKHNDDYSLDLFHFALYLSIPEFDTVFCDNYSAIFPYGVFIELLSLEKDRSGVPDYYYTCLFVLIQITVAGVVSKVPSKHLTQFVDDIVNIVRELRLSYAWISSIDYDAYSRDLYYNKRFHSSVYAVYTIARLDSRTLTEKDKPRLAQFTPAGIHRYMDTSHSFFFSVLGGATGPGISASKDKCAYFFKDAFLAVYQLSIRQEYVSVMNKLPLFYGVAQPTITLQMVEYIRRIKSLLSKDLTRHVNDAINMASGTLFRLASVVSLANIVTADRVYRKFCYSNFFVWLSELETIKGDFLAAGKGSDAYTDLYDLFTCWVLEFGVLPYYWFHERAGYLKASEEPFYYYVMYVLATRIILFYNGLLCLDLRKAIEKVARFEEEDYLVEDKDMVPLALELACVRYCRLAIYYRSRWLREHTTLINYYEQGSKCAVPYSDVLQLYNRYKVLTVLSRKVSCLCAAGADAQGDKLIPTLLDEMVSAYHVQKQYSSTDDLSVADIVVKVPSKEALIRAFRDTQSKIASVHLPSAPYYRRVLEQDILAH